MESFQKEKVDEIEIKISNPYISFSLNENSSHIFCGNDDNATAGLFLKIKSILEGRENKFLRFYEEKSMFIMYPILFIALITIILKRNLYPKYILSRYFHIFLDF